MAAESVARPSASPTVARSADPYAVCAPRQVAREAERRVIEYLRAHGGGDDARLAQIAREVVSQCAGTTDLAYEAVARAQERVERFLSELAAGSGDRVDRLWLRSFVEAHPAHFLGEIGAAREAAARFGDSATGELPRKLRMVPQDLTPMRWPSWLKGLVPPLALTASLLGLLLADLSRGGLTALELLWALAFAATFLLPALGLSVALIGFAAARAPTRLPPAQTDRLPPCVALMPIYHENAERVFAAVAAMRESLAATPAGGAFDIVVLSDSRDAKCAADEERAFSRVVACSGIGQEVAVYYRRRANNDRNKAGNLAEFFERFGDLYKYAIVLDADSLMSGATMVELARRMERAPRVALIQAALQLHRGRTLLARGQQLMASVCGPLLMRGLSSWSGPNGNYYGHNAIVRIAAFVECCGLPSLSGPPPLGGQFLSHDFVEAALLCRRGWQVQTAWDLQDSWEEMPQRLPEYLARERRWCQGNLQHLRIVRAEGLRAMSRVHLLVGALSYLGPLSLLAFLGVGVWLWADGGGLHVSFEVSLSLLFSTVLCFAVPRGLGWLEVACDRRRCRGHGGLWRLSLSVLIEATISVALAPLLLFHHASTVIGVACGRAVTWGAQRRDARGSLRELARQGLPATLLGLALAALLWALDATLLLWLVPAWAPLVLAVPLSLAVSSASLGGLAQRVGLMATPSELQPEPTLLCAERQYALAMSDEAARFGALVLDPALLSAHLDRLSPARPGPGLAAARMRAVHGGPAALSASDRRLLERDRESMRMLHHEAWRRWPLEIWRAAGRLPQAPPTRSSAP